MLQPKAPWDIRENESVEAHNAFWAMVDADFGNIDEAWRRFKFTEAERGKPENAALAAPDEWHEWARTHEWNARRDARVEEKARLAEVRREAEVSGGMSWTEERRQDFRERFAVYKSLRASVANLMATGACEEVRTKRTTRTADGWETTETVSRPMEGIREMIRLGALMGLSNAKVPQDANRYDLFMDLDTLTLPFGKPEDKIIYQFDPETLKSVAMTQSQLREKTRKVLEQHSALVAERKNKLATDERGSKRT
jgi:hypothetical protein